MLKIIPWLLLYTVAWGVGDYASKRFVQDRLRPLWITTALVAYFLNSVFWLRGLLISNTLARTGLIFAVASAIVTVTIGIFVFNERLDNSQTVGVAFGFVALALLLT